MTILYTPAAPLFLAALALAILPRLFKKGRILTYIGGLFWAVGTVIGLVDGASMTEVLVITLLLLTAAGWPTRRDAP